MKNILILPLLLLSAVVLGQTIPVPQKHIVNVANRCDSVISYLRHSGMPDAQLTYITILLKEATTPLINDVWAQKRKVDSLKKITPKNQ